MKATTFFRIAAVLLVLFAAGSTFGFLTFHPPTQEALAVRDAMANVHFDVSGKIYSYGGFYRGFGLWTSASLIFEAFLAFYLGQLAPRNPRQTKTLGWALFLKQVVGLVLSGIYFMPAPMIFSAALVLCIGIGTWLTPANTLNHR